MTETAERVRLAISERPVVVVLPARSLKENWPFCPSHAALGLGLTIRAPLSKWLRIWMLFSWELVRRLLISLRIFGPHLRRPDSE